MECIHRAILDFPTGLCGSAGMCVYGTSGSHTVANSGRGAPRYDSTQQQGKWHCGGYCQLYKCGLKRIVMFAAIDVIKVVIGDWIVYLIIVCSFCRRWYPILLNLLSVQVHVIIPSLLIWDKARNPQQEAALGGVSVLHLYSEYNLE